MQKDLFRVLYLRHVAADGEAYNIGLRIGANGDTLFKHPGKLTGAIVCHLYRALLAGTNGLLGILGNRTSATGYRLMNDKRSITGVGKGEGACLHSLVGRERSKVVCRTIERYLSLFGGRLCSGRLCGLYGLCGAHGTDAKA